MVGNVESAKDRSIFNDSCRVVSVKSRSVDGVIKLRMTDSDSGVGQIIKRPISTHDKRHSGHDLRAGGLAEKYRIVPLKMMTQRVLKFAVRLREQPLRASEAMHKILSMQVVFDCNVCNERFVAFHPAYEPPEEVAHRLEILRGGKSGLAFCNVKVSSWHVMLPTFEHHEDVAAHHYGVCACCQIDMNSQGVDQEGVPGDKNIIPKRSVENHMDPCFRFPYDDLQELFDGATMIEGMLVALEHMQIYFVSCTRTGLQKFHRNVISFPQDLSAFVSQHGLGRGYRVTDRVNSSRGPGQDLNRRPLKYWDPAVANMKEKPAYRPDGDIIYAAEVLEVKPDGSLLLRYDIGGQGVEFPSWVRPRAQMPWHPKDVPLVLHLRRNLGRGAVIEGLSVRWDYVSRLLRALCSFAPNGQVWRLGGGEYEAMHKYYDPKILDVLNVDDMRSRVEATSDIGTLPEELKSIGDLAIAGFRIKVNESESVDSSKSDVWVEEKTFVTWLYNGNFMVGAVVAAWWTGLHSTDPAGQNTYVVGC